MPIQHGQGPKFNSYQKRGGREREEKRDERGKEERRGVFASSAHLKYFLYFWLKAWPSMAESFLSLRSVSFKATDIKKLGQGCLCPFVDS